MKKTFKVLGIFTFVAVFLFVMIACDNGTTGGGNTDPKTISITGITGITGLVSIEVYSSFDDDYPETKGYGTISGGSITFELVNDQGGTPWTGSGSFFLVIGNMTGEFVFTNGKTFTELGIASEADIAKLPKYNISSKTSTIPFSLFQKGEF
jgi:hypothetical protein